METIHFPRHSLHCGGGAAGDVKGNGSATGGNAGNCLGPVLLLIWGPPTPPTLSIGSRLYLVTAVEDQVHLAGVMQPRDKELSYPRESGFQGASREKKAERGTGQICRFHVKS